MATAVKRSRQYETYGSVAYHDGYDGGAVRTPRREEVLPPQTRPRKRVLARPRVRVREAGAISIFGIVGFAVVFGLAVLLIMTYSQRTAVYNSTVKLESQLTVLKKDEATLLAHQEMAYDLQSIEKQVTDDGSMSKPRSSQQVVLDISEGDNAVRYQEPSNPVLSIPTQIRESVGTLFHNVLSYFN
jgi:hypothetical protein